MRKIIALTFLVLSLSVTSNAQAQDIFGSIVEASREAEEKRLREAPKLAEKLIPTAKLQSGLGIYLIDQLTIQSEQETKKSTARKIRNAVKKIQKDLNKLDKGISEWEMEDYDERLDKTSEKFEKHLKQYSSIIDPEINRIAEAKRAEQEKQDAYRAMCEGAVSDDPFAAFDSPSEEDRLLLTLDLRGSWGNRIKLQANEDGCMWMQDPKDSSILPELIDASLFSQNPNNKTQYVYNGVENMALILDFTKYQCLSQSKDGTRQKISCYNSSEEKVVAASSSQPENNSNSSSSSSSSDQLSGKTALGLAPIMPFVEACAEVFMLPQKEAKWFDKYMTGEIKRLISANEITSSEINSKLNAAQQQVDMIKPLSFAVKKDCDGFKAMVVRLRQAAEKPKDRF